MPSGKLSEWKDILEILLCLYILSLDTVAKDNYFSSKL